MNLNNLYIILRIAILGEKKVRAMRARWLLQQRRLRLGAEPTIAPPSIAGAATRLPPTAGINATTQRVRPMLLRHPTSKGILYKCILAKWVGESNYKLFQF